MAQPLSGSGPSARCSIRVFRKVHGPSSTAQGLDGDERDLPGRISLVVAEVRHRGDQRSPDLGTLVAVDLVGGDLLGRDATAGRAARLDRNLRVRPEVVVPGGMVRRPTGRGDDGAASLVREIDERGDAFPPALRASRMTIVAPSQRPPNLPLFLRSSSMIRALKSVEFAIFWISFVHSRKC